MANLNKTKLDASQCVVDAYDGVDESNRIQLTNPIILDAAQKTVDTFDSVNSSQKVSIVNSVEYAIEISAADGDSAIIYKDKTTVCNVTANSGGGGPVISAEVDCSQYSSFCVFTNINGNPAASGYVIVQGTCATTGSNFHDISDLIYAGKRPPAASATADATDKRGSSGVIPLSAKRIRLYIPAAGRPSTSSVEYSIVLST